MTAELVVGQNRVAFGLLHAHRLLENAVVMVRLYALEGREAQLLSEQPAAYHALETFEHGRLVHHHPDGTRHVHDEATDVRGFYTAQVTFPRPGPWGLEVLARQGEGAAESVRFTVTVLETPHTPALGTEAPRSRNLIASDVHDMRQIDSSEPPDPRLHQTRIADAITQGKPQVIVFATPRFCTSRMCGPVVEVIRGLLPAYSEQVAFIHQELWQDVTTQRLFPTVEEWKLSSEPWIFVVDRQGIIRAKFEGLVAAQEVEAVLQVLLTP
ncbi:MAG: thioredoxin family protein [Candidatus Tectomicrobia bacterium]|uniref:Thioredoxin family protein n=1 Tax=Tectimicrobiota bacterium TaxID=2528274 RepID=A0A937W3C2_UNCTE|nr:thioredoxin family protein [Candidatus Tectomicrobia bacterium]